MPMKRGNHPEKEREMLKKIHTEHELFHYKMLSIPAEEIYQACRKICFFECVYEYFQYEETSEEFVNAAWQGEAVLAELWEIYLKYEYLGMDTWEEIEGILAVYVREHITERG